MFGVGAISPNRIARLENLPPAGPEGDERFVQMNLTTLGAAARGENLKVAQSGGPSGPPEGGRPSKDEADQSARAAMRPVFVAAAKRLLTKENKAVSRAAEKHGREEFGAWLENFAVEQSNYFMDCFQPAAESLASMTHRLPVD